MTRSPSSARRTTGPVPAVLQGRGHRRRQAPALRRPDHARFRSRKVETRGLQEQPPRPRHHPERGARRRVELREVPDRPGRHRGPAVRAVDGPPTIRPWWRPSRRSSPSSWLTWRLIPADLVGGRRSVVAAGGELCWRWSWRSLSGRRATAVTSARKLRRPERMHQVAVGAGDPGVDPPRLVPRARDHACAGDGRGVPDAGQQLAARGRGRARPRRRRRDRTRPQRSVSPAAAGDGEVDRPAVALEESRRAAHRRPGRRRRPGPAVVQSSTAPTPICAPSRSPRSIASSTCMAMSATLTWSSSTPCALHAVVDHDVAERAGGGDAAGAGGDAAPGSARR